MNQILIHCIVCVMFIMCRLLQILLRLSFLIMGIENGDLDWREYVNSKRIV